MIHVGNIKGEAWQYFSTDQNCEIRENKATQKFSGIQ